MARKFALCFAMVLVFASAALAADVALTSVGQSPDSMMVRVVLRSLKVDANFNALMTPDDLTGEKVLIAVVGGSSKGLGAAGINAEDEAERARKLLQSAKESGKKILIMHVGGAGRRGTLSDFFIVAATPFADAIILVDGANEDGLFTTMAIPINAPIKTAANVKGTAAPLKEILTEWGVM